MARVPHQTRPLVEELRELRDIARREHGAQARSTRQIQEALSAAQAQAARRASASRPDGRQGPS